MRRWLYVTTIAAATACSGPDGTTPDAPGTADAPIDAPNVDAPVDAPATCGSVTVGAGLRATIAHAGGHFAVAYLAVGPSLAIAQFTDAGAAAGTATAAVPMLSSVGPAIAGRDGFLVAYIVPDGSIGLAALAPGGALSAPKTITDAPGTVSDLHLVASPTAAEFALTYTINDSTARFARVAADGTALSGPVSLPTVANERILASSYRSTGGLALVAHRASPASTNVDFVDDDGAVPNQAGVPEVNPQPPSLPGGFATVGDNYLLTLWDNTFELKLFKLSMQAVDDGNPITLATGVFFPGNLAANADGFAVAYADTSSVAHMAHATLAGVVDDNAILGAEVNFGDFPSVAVGTGSSRATAWVDKTPAVHVSIVCP